MLDEEYLDILYEWKTLLMETCKREKTVKDIVFVQEIIKLNAILLVKWIEIIECGQFFCVVFAVIGAEELKSTVYYIYICSFTRTI